MAETHLDAKRIIDGILEDARAEADKILNQARSAVEDRRMLLSGRIQRIKDEAARESREREAEIRTRTDNEIDRAHRRSELALKRDVLAGIQQRVRQQFFAIRKDDKTRYRRILVGWLVEAAAGLDTTEATVIPAAGDEQLINEILTEARETITTVTGSTMSLSVSSQSHGSVPGVIVSTPDGRTLYDNRIDARLRRNEEEIRRLVYEELFSTDTPDNSGVRRE